MMRGEEWFRQLMAQEPVVTRDQRQQVDWLVRGQYPIALGVGDSQAIDMMRRGLPIKAFDPERLAERSYVTSGTGSVSLLSPPPRPRSGSPFILRGWTMPISASPST